MGLDLQFGLQEFGHRWSACPETLIKANGWNGCLNLSTWAPESMRFACVTVEALP